MAQQAISLSREERNVDAEKGRKSLIRRNELNKAYSSGLR